MRRLIVLGLVLLVVGLAIAAFVIADPFAPPPSDRSTASAPTQSSTIAKPVAAAPSSAETTDKQDPPAKSAAQSSSAEPKARTTYLFCTNEWAEAWGDELRASKAYKESGKGWKWKTALVVKPDPKVGIEAESAIYLDLLDGDCLASKMATPEELEASGFVLVATPKIWKEVVQGKRSVNLSLITGDIELRKGNLTTLLKYIRSANIMVGLASKVPTEYPPGLQ